MGRRIIPYTVSERRCHTWAQEPAAQIGARTNFYRSAAERTVSWAAVR